MVHAMEEPAHHKAIAARVHSLLVDAFISRHPRRSRLYSFPAYLSLRLRRLRFRRPLRRLKCSGRPRLPQCPRAPLKNGKDFWPASPRQRRTGGHDGSPVIGGGSAAVHGRRTSSADVSLCSVSIYASHPLSHADKGGAFAGRYILLTQLSRRDCPCSCNLHPRHHQEQCEIDDVQGYHRDRQRHVPSPCPHALPCRGRHFPAPCWEEVRQGILIGRNPQNCSLRWFPPGVNF